MLNDKEKEILKNLINGETYSFKKISEYYNISERSSRYYVENIDKLLNLLGYEITKKIKNKISLNVNQDFNKIYIVINKNSKLSSEDRNNILKLILFFDEKGLNLTLFSKEYEISRTTLKKDIKLLEQNYCDDKLKLVYKNGKGYYFESFDINTELKKVELVEKILELKNKDILNDKILDIFNNYFDYNETEKILNAIEEVEVKIEAKMSIENKSKLTSYILILLKSKKEKDLISKNYLYKTEEYKIIKEIFNKNLKENIINENILLQITDIFMGISINNFKENSLISWLDEELMVRKLISKIGKSLKMNLQNDKILFEGLLYHLKPSMYRIKKGIHLSNSVFKELIISKDPILDIVKNGVSDIEKQFSIEFSEDEISLIGFHIKSAYERNFEDKKKNVILVCGLGYGSSKVLEQSIKEKYSIDIVDILPYSFIENSIYNYKNIDFVISTVDIDMKLEIPVIKINPLLKDEDMEKLKKYGLKRNKNKISLKKLMEIIKKNTVIENENKLINDLTYELKDNLIIDNKKIGLNLFEMLNENNVKIIEKVENWEQAVQISGDLLVENKFVNKKYVEEMIETAKKHKGYIVIEEGIAFPHASISENVYQTGISLLVVKEKIFFENGKGANIFLSFSTVDKLNHVDMLNDLFELITKYKFVEKISKIEKYEELIDYFQKELLC